LFGTLFTSPLMLWELSVTPVSWRFGWEIWAGVLYIGIISTAGAFYLWNKGFELLHEHLGASFFAGAVFIFLGVALSNLQQPKESSRQSQA